EGAAGYVIYRRAWSSTTNGWTDFARWDNTTETTYLDGHDAAHKVYAGTRYQYGVKAYFARRTDPVAETQIGGNVNDPSGNFNLGMVGPLKTTVRITTRELKSVTAGTKQLTVKWGGSTVFTGYQIQYATNSAFTKGVKSFKIDNPKTVSTVIKNLKTGTTYYVRIRSYHEFNGMTYYGEWSNVRSAKVK
ncbi:MAG: fibronectin type III domain-containing protein, partial [Clostridia bacterium]|nr:fibronectin type III domain-containing protein [Clostridia bacterium]